MQIENILIIDPDFQPLEALNQFARENKLQYRLVNGGNEALRLLEETSYDLILTELILPDFDGLTLISKIKKLKPQIQVVILTEIANVEKAASALKLGIRDYLVKPISDEKLKSSLKKIVIHVEQKDKLPPLSEGLIAHSPQMKKILREAALAAKSNANIFIHGESGSGKEVIAQYIHNQSLRSDKSFIKVNCAAIPETLIESEFFGHEKGAFTGALNTRIGRFELADKGTLLLDEISEVPIMIQPKLLRVIQEQEFERLGAMISKKVNVRLISTSNRDMPKSIVENLFREDLYFRLNVIPIYLPPLRERKEDILLLANYLIKTLSKANERGPKFLTPETEELFLKYHWPGNVRELRNVIERAVIMGEEDVIKPEDLALMPSSTREEEAPKLISLADIEEKHIQHVLEHCNQNKTQAAKILDISVRTLRNKLKV